MMGEEINSSVVTEKGLLGDRQFALIDPSTGKAVSAKNPSRWPNLFNFRAFYTEAVESRSRTPPVRISLPDGRTILNHDASEPDRHISCIRLSRYAPPSRHKIAPQVYVSPLGFCFFLQNEVPDIANFHLG